MDNTFFIIAVALAAVLVSLLSLALTVIHRRRAAKLSQELTTALDKLATAHAEVQSLEQRLQETATFQKNLSEAELTTRLQQPRLSAQHGYQQVNAPERYLYVKSLAQNGMSAEEIAAVLKISPKEAEQLVNLARLAANPS